MDGAGKWLPQGGRLEESPSLLLRPCLWAVPSLHPVTEMPFPGPSFEGSTYTQHSQPALLTSCSKTPAAAHHIHVPELLKSLTSPISVEKLPSGNQGTCPD